MTGGQHCAAAGYERAGGVDSLAAEGEAEAVRRVADAERYKREVEGAGQANAITIVFNAIREAQPDDKLIAIQYLDSLKSIANGTATKVFLPYEASGILGALGGIQEIFRSGGTDGGAPATAATTSAPPHTPPAYP